MTSPDVTEELAAEDLGRIHLVGIGGVGMSGLARLLLIRAPRSVDARTLGYHRLPKQGA